MAVGAAAGAAVIGGFLKSKAAGSAADVQAKAAKQAAAESRRQFNITEANLAPFREGGTQAFQQQAALSGALGPGEEARAFAAFDESPGQRFLRERGQRALIRNQTAIGGIGGGNIRRALVEQGIGFAQQDFGDRFGRLGAISGAGLQAAGQTGQFGAIQAQQQGLFLQQGAQARAQGILGKSEAVQGALQGVAGAFGAGSGFQ